MTERTYRVLSGLIAVLTFSAAVVLGAKLSSGAAKPIYHVSGTFSAAGQGLLSGSDVKIHGVNIGKVSTIKLVDGQALIRLTIDEAEKIPVDAQALIRPKTLFGEKFIDIAPGDKEATGPFLRDGGVIKNTQGGFEFERVLADAYPVLRSFKPEDLGTILSTLARGGQGVAPNVNRSIQNLAVIATAQAGNVAETQRFIDDLAAISTTLADHAEETAQGIEDAHAALPTLNARAAQFTSALSSLATLSGDVADLLENNRPLLRKLVTTGGNAVAALNADRDQLPKVVLGLRQFFQTLAESGSGISYGDGTVAKVKIIVGGQTCEPALSDCSGDRPPGFRVNGAKAAAARPPLSPPATGVSALRELMQSLVD